MPYVTLKGSSMEVTESQGKKGSRDPDVRMSQHQATQVVLSPGVCQPRACLLVSFLCMVSLSHVTELLFQTTVRSPGKGKLSDVQVAYQEAVLETKTLLWAIHCITLMSPSEDINQGLKRVSVSAEVPESRGS